MVTTPATYDEAAYRAFLVNEADRHAAYLGWTTASTPVTEALYDALFAYHGSAGGALADATAIDRLRRLGRRAIWKRVVDALSSRIDQQYGQSNVKLGDLYEQAKERYAEAMTDAAGLDRRGSGGFTLTTLRFEPAEDDASEYARDA